MKAMDGPKKDTGDLETIGMICKSYGWSVKRYRCSGEDRNNLQSYGCP